jgi:hypothetical protein
MFIPDRRKALQAIRRTLKRGCKFATVVWSEPARNPYLNIPLQAVSRRFEGSDGCVIPGDCLVGVGTK